jgi:hypothetical protein
LGSIDCRKGLRSDRDVDRRCVVLIADLQPAAEPCKMPEGGACPKEQPARSAALSAVLDYVAERGAIAATSDDERSALAALLLPLTDHLQALEKRNCELEAAVRSLRNMSEQLQHALREAQLGFRRHIRQRVSDSALQAALAFPTAADTTAPNATTDESISDSVATPTGGESSDALVAQQQSSDGQLSADPSTPQPPPAGRPSNKKRDPHGRGKVGVIPQIFIEIVPTQVQLEGLQHFERIGVEDSPVLGYRRGGPIQVVFRRVKFVAKSGASSESRQNELDASTAAPKAISEEMSATSASPPTMDQSSLSAVVSAAAPAPSVSGSATTACGPVGETIANIAAEGESDPVSLKPTDSRAPANGPVAVTASDVLCVPADPAFKRSPFVDGALVWYVPEPPDLQPERPVLIADLPERALVRGMADASLIAHAISHKLDFHMPYYRQQTELRRHGLPLSRANLCRWHFEAGACAIPIADAMWEEALQRRWFAMDATSTAIFDKTKYRKGHIYVLVAPGDSVLFRYAPKYDGPTVQKLFGNTNALVVADACATNNPAFGPGKVRGCGCWSHLRKRWVAAFDAGEKGMAAPGLLFIRKLFLIEDAIALLSVEDRLTIRNEKSAPLVDALYEYIDRCPPVDADHPMYDALNYPINQKELLCRFLSNGEIPIHNNWSEGALRRVVKGRAAWLFMFSDEHAEHTCALISLLASCDQHGLDPEFYLQEVLTVAPSWPRSRVLELSPKYWLQTRQHLIRNGSLRYIDLAQISGSKLVFRPS